MSAFPLHGDSFPNWLNAGEGARRLWPESTRACGVRVVERLQVAGFVSNLQPSSHQPCIHVTSLGTGEITHDVGLLRLAVGMDSADVDVNATSTGLLTLLQRVWGAGTSGGSQGSVSVRYDSPCELLEKGNEVAVFRFSLAYDGTTSTSRVPTYCLHILQR